MAAQPIPTARLFIALWPGPAARRALLDWSTGWRWPADAAVVAPEKWHLTLHFIGAVPVSRLPELVDALNLPCPHFRLEFGRAELWPRGLAVLAPIEPPPALVGLHGQLAQVLRRLHLPVEQRVFRPHLTLARKAIAALPPAQPPHVAWPVRRFALVQSEGGYRTLARFPD